jgi:hypothetical protein
VFAAGAWKRDARGRWQLQASPAQQLLRLATSTAVTAFLLLAAGAVLAACLNFQGLIVPSHSLVFMPKLAALGARAADGGAVLQQVRIDPANVTMNFLVLVRQTMQCIVFVRQWS